MSSTISLVQEPPTSREGIFSDPVEVALMRWANRYSDGPSMKGSRQSESNFWHGFRVKLCKVMRIGVARNVEGRQHPEPRGKLPSSGGSVFGVRKMDDFGSW